MSLRPAFLLIVRLDRMGTESGFVSTSVPVSTAKLATCRSLRGPILASKVQKLAMKFGLDRQTFPQS